MTTPTVEVLATSDALALRAGAVLGEAIAGCLRERGRCRVAFSRLSSTRMLRTLDTFELNWRAVDIFQVDERFAPYGHTQRNLTMLQRFVRQLRPAPRLHQMPVVLEPSEAARRYEDELVEVCGAPPVLDVVHLGLGPDGHTASLVPGDLVLDITDRCVATTDRHASYRRLTLTYPVLDAARSIVFVVSGAEKAEAVKGVLAGDERLPAARLRSSDITLLLDESAATELPDAPSGAP